MKEQGQSAQTFDSAVISSVRILPKNRFWIPQAKKKFLGICGPQNFEKKNFFRLKNRMVKVGCGSQKCIPEHFFECSKCPLYHMSISQKFILDSKILVFWGSEGVKIPYFSRQKIFFEIWTSGMRGTSNITKSVLECIFGPHNPLEPMDFQMRKKIFFKNLCSKIVKNKFLGLWDKKTIFLENVSRVT